MEHRISVLTIATKDFSAMKKFYEQTFDWEPLVGNDGIVFYKLNGFLLSLCDKETLSDFVNIDRNGKTGRTMTIGYNVDSADEVKKLYTKLKEKRVNIIKEPSELPFGGLFFYFTDIEQNIWEISYNPYIKFDKENNIIGHEPIDDL